MSSPRAIPTAASTLLLTSQESASELARRHITCEFAPAAEQKFLTSNDEASIRRFIAEGFLYWVAERNNELIGFVGVRNSSHLYHLFVADSAQRQGVARKLWQTAMETCRAAGNPGRFTVNSSNNAVAVYESLGFVRSGPQQSSDGVLFNPMVLEVAALAAVPPSVG